MSAVAEPTADRLRLHLARIRKNQRVTVTELAARMHAATTTVYSLEQIRGRDMKLGTIEAWAAGLGLRARIVLEPLDAPIGGEHRA